METDSDGIRQRLTIKPADDGRRVAIMRISQWPQSGGQWGMSVGLTPREAIELATHLADMAEQLSQRPDHSGGVTWS
jgi:hypothetical protein